MVQGKPRVLQVLPRDDARNPDIPVSRTQRRCKYLYTLPSKTDLGFTSVTIETLGRDKIPYSPQCEIFTEVTRRYIDFHTRSVITLLCVVIVDFMVSKSFWNFSNRTFYLSRTAGKPVAVFTTLRHWHCWRSRRSTLIFIANTPRCSCACVKFDLIRTNTYYYY